MEQPFNPKSGPGSGRTTTGRYRFDYGTLCVCGCPNGDHAAGADDRGHGECTECGGADCPAFRKAKRKRAPNTASRRGKSERPQEE